MEQIANLLKANKPNAYVIVTSDTCSKDSSKDISGSYVVERLKYLNLFKNIEKSIVADDRDEIKDCLKTVLVEHSPALIITVGGTGLCPRDVTPEATSSLYNKSCSGIVAALHMSGLQDTPHAALSRLTAGLIEDCLVINFPGNEKACRSCFDCLKGFIEHALEQVRFDQTLIYSREERDSNTNELKNSTLSSKDGPKKAQPSKSANDKQQQNSSSRPQVITTSMRIIKDTSDRTSIKTRNILDQLLARNVFKSGLNSQTINDQSSSTAQSETENFVPSSSGQNYNSLASLTKFKLKDRNLEHSNTANNHLAGSKKEFKKALLKESPYPLISYENALNILKGFSGTLLNTNTAQKFELSTQSTANRALYLVLAENIRSKALVPPYSVSTMDGYVANIPQGMASSIDRVNLPLKADLLDNVDQLDIYCSRGRGNRFLCCQINTGDRLPRCDFFVVPTEQAKLLPNDKLVYLYEAKPGKYIRRQGSDLNESDMLRKGTIIGPVELSLILSMGYRSVKLWRRPRIGILSTGDELVGAFTPFQSNANNVVDVNAPLLTTLLGMYKYPAVQFGLVIDDPNEIYNKLQLACSNCDILIMTGGASMGSKDWTKQVIEKQLGGKIHFGRVNIKPGKPVSFATVKNGNKLVPIFSLPGNPVSAYITALILVLPFLEHGVKHHFDPDFPLDLKLIGDLILVEVAKLEDTDDQYDFDGRYEFVRAKLIDAQSDITGRFPVSISMRQQSSRLLSLSDFNCLVLVGTNWKGRQFSIGDTFWACKVNNVKQ